MKLQDIIDQERALRAVVSRLTPLLQPDLRAALERAEFIAVEMRHFAVCWADADATGNRDFISATRRELQGRLMQLAIPEQA